MKNASMIALLFAGMLLGSLTSVAWSQDAEPTGRVAYCKLIAYRATAFAAKTKVELDFGESSAFVDKTLRDEMTGKAAKFNSEVDALNEMAALGWEMDGGYVVAGGNSVYVFYLKKQL